MAELISRCASLRAAGEPGDGEAWVTAAATLGGRPTGDEIASALRRHAALAGTQRGGYDHAVIFDAASDGLHVIVGMLIVGLVFIGVIALGELAKAASHRRKARRPSSY